MRSQQEELQRLASLQRTERWLHDRLIAMLPAAVLVTDGQGVIRTANAAAAGLLRLRLDRLVRKPVFSFHRGDRPRRGAPAALPGGGGW